MSPIAIAEMNPYQRWLARIQDVMRSQNASGWVTVRCTDELELHDDTYSDDERDGSSSYTQQEVDYIRCVVLPPEREKAAEDMTRLILGGQQGTNIKLFDPKSFATNVLTAFDKMSREFKNKRHWSKKFNILFGFTMAIKQYDSWVDVNDGDGQIDGMIDDIGNMWKRVLKRTSEELEIDDEFTRPGIECFLQKFMEYHNVGGRDDMMDFDLE